MPRSGSRGIEEGGPAGHVPCASARLGAVASDLLAKDYSDEYDRLKDRFHRRGRPIEVNFRKLVPLHSGVDRATHLMHAYPAKLLLNIPLFFLGCRQFGAQGKLLDPFCGSGTVLVEGALRGWELVGADANPLARMITQAKLTYIEPGRLAKAMSDIRRASSPRTVTFDPVVNVDRWFPRKVQDQLGAILGAIHDEQDPDVRRFFEVCISSCLRKLSYADPRLSVPVRMKLDATSQRKLDRANVMEVFERAAGLNMRRVERLVSIEPHVLQSLRMSEDARVAGEQDIDLIITSPPYAGAQKYVRASTFSIGWLRLACDSRLRPLERVSIGREHFCRAEYSEQHVAEHGLATGALKRIRSVNPLRAHIVSTYLSEMKAALASTTRRLKRGGKLIMVVGNNTVCGAEFKTSRYVAEIAKSLGLRLELELLDDIRSRGLMTKRNTTAGVIQREHVQVFAKP